MKLSYTTMATPGMSVSDEVDLARRFGYNGIDLRVSDHLGELKLNSPSHEIKEIKVILQSAGISLAGLFCYNRCAGADKSSWVEMKESILRHLELAAIIGSPSIRIFAGDPLKHAAPEDFIKKTAEIIAEALGTDRTDISVLLQNHLNGFSAAQGVTMAELIGNNRFGLAFSPDHCVLMGEKPEQIAEMLKKHTKQLYAADLTVNGDGHKSTLPGKGTVDLKKAFDLIGGLPFGGWITFKWEKIWNPELETAEIALPHFKEYVTSTFN